MPESLHRAFISIGSNMGRRIHYLREAVEAIASLSRAPLRCSAVYETSPVDYEDQADFLNMVVECRVSHDPIVLLDELLRIERENRRQRTIRFGPRTLDLDILLYDSIYVCYQRLQIPHPRMWQRAFVMVPLADLDPHRRVPGGRTAAELAKALAKEGSVRYVGHFW